MHRNSKHCQAFKILIIGDVSVGKSSIVASFFGFSWDSEQLQTIGVDFKAQLIDVKGEKVKLELWDTAGQEKYKTLIRGFYRGASGIVLVYDKTNRKSLENLRGWIEEAVLNTDEHVTKMILGNKKDLDAPDLVRYDEAKAFADQYGMKVREVSAKTSENVFKAFQELASDMMEKKGDDDNGYQVKYIPISKDDKISVLNLPPRKEPSSSCC